MDWISWSQIWSTKSTTTTSRRPLRRRRKNSRWKRMYSLLQGQSKTTKTYFSLLIYKNCTYFSKILDWYWARNLFAYRLPTGKKTDYLPREEDGAIEFWRFKDYLRNDFEHSQHWSDEMWKSRMAGGGGNNKRFQYCIDSSGQEILYLWALQGHSGRNPIDPSLQENVLILNNFFEYIYQIGCAIILHSITNSGLIPGGQKLSRERQTVFFTAVNPMDKEHKDPYELDLTKPRLAWYKLKTWKRHQDTVYWVDIQIAQRTGLKFYQTRCNAIILYDTLLPASWISKVVLMEPGEIIFEKENVSPRLPLTISFKDNWMKELDSEVVGSSKDTRRIQPKPKTQLSRTERSVGGQESTKFEEIDIDFRVPGLSHAVVKEAEHFRIQELVKKIESHPHREALQADLQQNNVYNPSSHNSKATIREMGNVELFELCETIPWVQCSHCLLHWNQGIVYCTCGQFLVESESRRKFNKLRLYALFIPHYVIKKGRCHGARHRKPEEQK